MIPNPWDRGSAAFLARAGFPALATSSAGYAFTRALPDSPEVLSRDAVLDHIRDIVQATPLPVNADFQSGYAGDLASLAESVLRCVETGVAGLSIEDATGRAERPLFEVAEAIDRVQAARQAIDASGSGVLLTARAECFLTGHGDALRESIRRLQAYAEAGADVLYAPGPRDRETIRAIVDAVAPKPVNVLVGRQTELRVADLAELGVRRVSLGSALARVAWTAFATSAQAIADRGEFSTFEGVLSTGDVSRWFSDPG